MSFPKPLTPTLPSHVPHRLRIGSSITLSAQGFEDTYGSWWGEPKTPSSADSYAWTVLPALVTIGSPSSQTTAITATTAGSCVLRCGLEDIFGAVHVFERSFLVPDAITFYFHASEPSSCVIVHGSASAEAGFARTATPVETPATVQLRPTTDPASCTLTASARDDRGDHVSAYDSGLTSISWNVTGGDSVLLDDGAGNPVPTYAGDLEVVLLVQRIGLAQLTLTAQNSLRQTVRADCYVNVLGPTSADFVIQG